MSSLILNLRLIVFHFVFYTSVILTCLLSMPLFFLPRRFMRKLIALGGRYVLFLLKYIIGLDYVVQGLENIPPTPCLIACKHQSMWETVALNHLLSKADFVTKQELFWIPFVGWAIQKSGAIGINRKNTVTVLRELLHQCSERVRRGNHIILFPEGTRRAIGAPPDYKSGIAGVYQYANLPCVPVALNSGLFWPRRSLRRYAGTVRIHFLPLIAAGLPRRQFMQTLEEAIETETAKLI